MKQFIQTVQQHGFAYINGNIYNKATSSNDSYMRFKDQFSTSLKPDGVRNRSYLKLTWDRPTGAITINKNQGYFQSSMNNTDDGGKVRNFAPIDPDILNSDILQNIISSNTDIIKSFEPLSSFDKLTLGIHFLQYKVFELEASYSSPVGLHVDDEPLVFVHLIDITNNAIGGDNLIANLKNKEITNVVRLTKPLDTLVLSQKVYHAVTPLGSSNETAYRNVILFTVEADQSQKWSDAV